MIGKVKISNNKSFADMCAYVGGETKEAEVLATHGVRDTSAAHMAEDFDAQRELNPDLGRAVMHVALAWPPEEKAMSNELMLELTLAWMKKMGIDAENTQWSLTRHGDKNHPHGHLIINRVDNDGATVSDQHNFRNSLDACRKLEKQYGLADAQEAGQDNRRAKREQLPKRDAAKLYVQDALSRHLPHATSPAELAAAMQRDGIGMQATYQKGKLQAVVFEYDGHHLKGSELGRSYSGNNLAKTLDAQRAAAVGQQSGQLGAEIESFGLALGAQKQTNEKDAQRALEQKQADEKDAQRALEKKQADEKDAQRALEKKQADEKDAQRAALEKKQADEKDAQRAAMEKIAARPGLDPRLRDSLLNIKPSTPTIQKDGGMEM